MLILARGRTAVWGHASAYVSDSSLVDSVIEKWQMRRAVRTFAYTQGGGEFAKSVGVGTERITIVQNSLDTDAMRGQIAVMKDEVVEKLRAEHDLYTPDIACFVGALDGSKRLDMLLDIADYVVGQMPNFRLLVAGAGPLEASLIEAIRSRPHVLFLGRADLALKAIIARLSRGMLMPGRVGLVAVDSFAMGVPIITSTWRYHAPEFEYLVNGENALVAPEDSITAIGEATVRLMRDDPLHTRLRDGCLRSTEQYSLQHMVQRFADGVEMALTEPSTAPRGSRRLSRRRRRSEG
jgi:glycosyltransferase involved in cell wall biosynthesis